MTTWSAADPTVGHLKVGISVSTSDSTPSFGESITITVDYYVETVNWTYNDTVTLTYEYPTGNGTTSTATYSFNMNLGSNQSMKILTKTHTYTAGASSIAVKAGSSISGAYDSANPSLSNTTRYTIPSAASAPSTPATPTAGATTTTSQAVNWTAPANNGSAITGYKLAYRTHPSGGWSYVSLGNVLTYTITGLSIGTNYDVEVQAINAVGGSAYSSALNFTTTGLAPTDPTAASTPLVDGSTSTTPGIKGYWNAGATNGSTGDAFDVYVNTTGTLGSPSRITTGVASGGVVTQYDNGSALVAIASNVVYYAWVRVKWTTPAGSPSATWVSLGSVTTSVPGGSGDETDRVNALAAQIGSDIANPICVVAPTSTQSMAQAPSTTAIIFAGPVTIGGNVHSTGTTLMWAAGSPSQLTIPKAGTYKFEAMLTYAGTTWTAGKYAEAAIQVNGTTVGYNIVYPGAQTVGSTPVPVSCPPVKCAVGDVVTLVGLQSLTAGTFQNIANFPNTWLSAERTGP